MQSFYQLDYAQPGLTTDLPGPAALQQLIETQFRGCDKDFSRIIELLTAVGVAKGARILDYGANWGYGVWQLGNAGFDVVGFELSKRRGEFGARLGVTIFTEWNAVLSRAPFDVVLSTHVLEHMPDPAGAIREQMALLEPGGWLIAIFPNGSEPFRDADPEAFHRLWGQVHPVMLNDEFVSNLLGRQLLFLGNPSPGDLNRIRGLVDGVGEVGNLAASEMMLVARKRLLEPTVSSAVSASETTDCEGA